MNEETAKAILAELSQRNTKPYLSKIVDPTFPEQSKFVQDESQSIVAQCTRRAGKSHGLALRLYRAAIKHPGSTPLYIALTRDSAKKIMWPVMNEVNRLYGLDADLTESNLTATLPNRSQISLVGADMKNFIERLRGPKYPEVCIDEAGSFRSHLQSLIEDILEPATLDYNGSIVLAGTPGVVPRGVFYEASNAAQKGWSKHSWSLFQNPYLPDPRAFVERIKKKRGWSDQNPTFQREYLGEWVLDLDALVYKFRRDRNLYSKLPEGHDFHRVLVIDYGYDDQTAFGVVSFSPTLRKAYGEWAEGHREMIPSQIAARIQQLREKFNPVKIIADTGALGKMITEEMIRRYQLPIHPAEKKEKLTNISLLNGDFIDGNFMIHESLGSLHEQYETLTKDDNGLEDPGLPNDLCDVMLYGYREAKHYLGSPKENKYAEGSKEYGDQIAKKLFEEDVEALEKEERSAWWER